MPLGEGLSPGGPSAILPVLRVLLNAIPVPWTKSDSSLLPLTTVFSLPSIQHWEESQAEPQLMFVE